VPDRGETEFFGGPTGFFSPSTQPHMLVSVALEPGADEMVSVRLDAAAEAEMEKIRLLASLMRNWHLSEASGSYPQYGWRAAAARITSRSNAASPSAS
jgi:hypothetical protein